MQVRQVVAGGMHSVAVTEAGDIFTTGVNDEAALGRRTGHVNSCALLSMYSSAANSGH